MATVTNRSRDVLIPAPALQALRRALTEAVGADAAARALRRAGHAAGVALAGPVEDARDMDEALFWERVAELFASRGWGRLTHEAVHAGVGALECGEWAEAEPSSGAAHPSCHFTTGLLADLLGRAAGDEVGVLEVECRSRGDLRCRFLFGSRPALDAVYAEVAGGRAADEALATLG